MKRSVIRPAASLFILTGVLVSSACSHYLWVSIDPKAGEHGTTNLYFEGGPGLGW